MSFREEHQRNPVQANLGLFVYELKMEGKRLIIQFVCFATDANVLPESRLYTEEL